MATATAVEPASSAAAMEAAAGHVAVVATATITRACITVTRPSIAVAGTPIPIAVTAAIAVDAAVSISVAAIPRPGTDKDAAVEPRRSVVPIRRASVWIVAVVAIRADRSRVAVAVTPIHRSTDPNSNRYLGMRIGRGGDQQDTEYSEIA
jgi:hypothetical protein